MGETKETLMHESPPTVDQMVAMLKQRIFESIGRDNNVIETPDDMCIQAAKYLETAKELLVCLLENDPQDPIDDVGHVVLDLWRHDARRFLDLQPPTKVSAADLAASIRSESIAPTPDASAGTTRYKHSVPNTLSRPRVAGIS